MLIAVTGPDGAGKSTVCKKVVTQLEEKYGPGSVVQISVWDAVLSSGLFTSKAEIVRYLSNLDDYTRTLFIYHGLSRSIDLGKRKSPRFQLVEGHWYKYAVTEIGHGVSRKAVLGAAQGFPVPDLTFYLEVEASVALSRKKAGASEYEQGSHYSADSGEEESSHSTLEVGSADRKFLRFQQCLRPIWSEMEQEFGPWIHMTTTRSSELVASDISEQIFRKL